MTVTGFVAQGTYGQMLGTPSMQAYVSRVLDLVDSVVDDVGDVGPELGGITAILAKDVNVTDLDANIQARASQSPASCQPRLRSVPTIRAAMMIPIQ